MASFMATLFPSSKEKSSAAAAAAAAAAAVDISPRPGTPNRNSFVNPASTPQGSPSKKTVPPGANEVPAAFDSAPKLNGTATSGLDSPLRLGRPQGNAAAPATPLSPSKSNIQHVDESSLNVEDSVLHKGGILSAGSALKKQGQENTPPASSRPVGGTESPYLHNHAALSRHELYQSSRPTTPAKKFNTSRGLTPEELEILQKPNVRRMVNVTQLCEYLRVISDHQPSTLLMAFRLS
jgi:hypothetical protein